MKKILSIAASAAVLSVAAQLPSQAQSKDSYIGPTIVFGGGNSAFGVNGKFGVAENISVRPIAIFGSGNTVFGAAATYDFKLPGQSAVQFEPFAGIGVSFGNASSVYAQLGTDFGITDSIMLNADLKVPLSGGGTLIGIGAGFKF